MKKQSGTKRRKEVKFFIDRSLGRIDVPNALRAAGYSCERHDDYWGQTTEDVVWLAEVAERKWVALTKDEKIRYRPLEIAALKSAGLRTFILICGNLRGEDTAKILLAAMPKIMQIVQSESGPFIYYIYKDSSLKRIF